MHIVEQKKIAGEKAAEYIRDGMTVGLGTGSTAFYMINKVGEMVRGGLKIKAVATSKETERLARSLHIPVVDIDTVDTIDLVIDGVDKIDRCFNAIKGGGGALFREKIVASMAKEIIWIMDKSKTVDDIGRFDIPVEVLPFGYTHVMRQLAQNGFVAQLRLKDGARYMTDNINYVVDVWTDGAGNILDIKARLDGIVGVLETGLFLNMCARIIVGTDSGAVIYENERKEIGL
jgi:ribose 5-phosphate isomerase A